MMIQGRNSGRCFHSPSAIWQQCQLLDTSKILKYYAITFKCQWPNIPKLQGVFFKRSRPKSSKCRRWQNPYQKSESKGMSQRRCENLTKTFTFLVGILPSPTLRTFRAGPFEKNTLYEIWTQTFTFLVGILPSPTLRTFRAGPVKKITL